MRLDEKNSENASLQRQLESAITDLKRQKELEREHISLAVSTLSATLLPLAAFSIPPTLVLYSPRFSRP